MGRGAVNLSMLLISKQSTFGSMLTTLNTVDFIETIGEAKMKVNPGMNPLKLVGNGFDQDAMVPGSFDQDVSFQIPLRTGGANNPGQLGKVLLLSTMSMVDSPSGTYTYTFVNAQGSMSDATIWGYSGSRDTAGALLCKAFNAVFSPKFSIESGKFGILDISTKAAFTPWIAATQPAVTKERTIPSALVGATTLTIAGSTAYKVISLEIDPQVEIKLAKDPTAAYGYGVSVLTNREIKWKAKVYRDIPGVVDPLTALTGKTIAALTVEYGAVPQKIKMDSQYTQITNIDNSDEEGVETWDIEGICARNDFRLVLTTA